MGKLAPEFDFDSGRSRGAIVTWIPVMVGVALMIGMLFAVFILIPRGGSDGVSATGDGLAATRPGEAPPPPVPGEDGSGVGADQGLGSDSMTPGRASESLPISPSRGLTTMQSNPRRPASPTVAAADPDVVGRYRVVSSFGDSFIGEVLVSNTSVRSQGWTVQLRFPSNVGELRNFWVEAQRQATLRRSGQTYTFTSTADIGPGSSAQLRFQFDRTGQNNFPGSCTVDGATCGGL